MPYPGMTPSISKNFIEKKMALEWYLSTVTTLINGFLIEDNPRIVGLVVSRFMPVIGA